MNVGQPRAVALEGQYLGLISGTSMDGIDAVLLDFSGGTMRTLGSATTPYTAALRERLFAAILPHARLGPADLATLHIAVGQAFAATANALLAACGVRSESVVAIGSHGQTLHHAPRGAEPYSLQIGDGATIAARTGITTVADFRALDVAYGGEGAPLVPPFHEWSMSAPGAVRVVANIGGIGNITVLADGDAPPLGFDTGPGNCLLDVWSAHHRGLAFDDGGAWAASGTVLPALLRALLDDPYYTLPAPKSTGRELFNMAYLERALVAADAGKSAAADVQATLLELTVETLARAIERNSPRQADGVFVCGGGARNARIMERLANRLAPTPVTSTATLGLDPDMIEASAFAWLAAMRMGAHPVRLTTAARFRALRLGAVYLPTATGCD